MSRSPLQGFQHQLTQENFVDDPAQHQAILHLEALYQTLQATSSGTRKLGTLHPSNQAPIKGLYLWGDVGRGKTMLMDLFCQSLPEGMALRLHFHRFMERVHNELKAESGKRDPLRRIAARLGQSYRVICFDEFFVSDIGDAMILSGLFEALFDHGITLVATSNTPIDRLYENGLARDRFLPCIALLEAHTDALHLDGGMDHRLRHLDKVQTYFRQDKGEFARRFDELEPGDASTSPLTILGREIAVIRRGTSTLWLDFDALCGGPRSQLDYIAIASQFDTLLLSQVPPLGGTPRSWIRARGTEDGAAAVAAGDRQLNYAPNDDPARRFIALVDELYDQGVKLYLEASLPLEQLYTPGALAFEFRRTMSRLVEMQSRQYLNASRTAGKA
ncbi:AFG1 family ATPase [Shewanella insulae]|uniref:cell division protein ZapE n=1 Tax=Shewanella insulae TaxID=2681496 RepID=UPI001EFE5EED|nr:cell division protein ZapE [Shewanella insulae]MCG9754760.1 AFG1 family ATPase [Shewanella insulae]